MVKRHTKRPLVLQSVMPPSGTPRLGVVAFVAGLTAGMLQTICFAVWLPQLDAPINSNNTEVRQK